MNDDDDDTCEKFNVSSDDLLNKLNTSSGEPQEEVYLHLINTIWPNKH